MATFSKKNLKNYQVPVKSSKVPHIVHCTLRIQTGLHGASIRPCYNPQGAQPYSILLAKSFVAQTKFPIQNAAQCHSITENYPVRMTKIMSSE